MDVQLRARDIDLLLVTAEARFISTSLAAEEFFGHRKAALRRLHQLATAGLLVKVQHRVTAEALWQPTAAAVRALEDAGELPAGSNGRTWRLPSPLFVEHEMGVARLHAAVRRTAPSHPDVTAVRFLNGAHLAARVKDRDGVSYAVRPDAFLALTVSGSRLWSCVEFDRSTKPFRRRPGAHAGDVVRQLWAYNVAFQTDWLAEKLGRPGRRPEEYPFRVLTVCGSWTRLSGMCAAMIAEMRRRGLPPSSLRGYGLSGQVLADPLAQVWLPECELAPLLIWLEQQPVGAPLAGCLHPQRDADVRRALADWGRVPYRRQGRRGVTCDPAVRAAFVQALLATERIERFSVLEAAWPGPESEG